MFKHARSNVSNWTSRLILILGICEISCKCLKNGGPAPMPKPKPAEIIDPETTLKQRAPPIHPHKLTPPPLPSGSIDSYDSDQHKYNLTESGEERNKYGVNRYGVQRSNEFKLGIQHWADDEVMLMFPRYPPLRSFEKHYGRYGGLNARRFWAHWDIPDDRSANGFHSGFHSDNVMGGRPPPVNSHDFEYKPNRYPKRYYMRSYENPKPKKRVQRAVAHVKNIYADEGFNYDMKMVNPYAMGGRPPPGKTERKKRKTQEMANTFAIQNKREVTPQMNPVVKKKIERVRRELDSYGHEETLDKLKKRNKKDTRGIKRDAFRSWMKKIVPEHAAHIEKLHDKGIDKLIEQKAHGLKKTYGELFHEHHENSQHEKKEYKPRHFDMHDDHHLDIHGEHEPMHEGHKPHHFETKDHHELHEGHEPHQFEMHDGHEPHHPEKHEPDHLEIHAGEHDPHHMDREKLDEEHKLKARKKLLEEMYLKEGKKSHEIKDKNDLEETEHEESPPAQTAAAPAQQAQQQQYQQQLYQQQQQNQMYNQQQNQQYNNYNNYGGGGGGMGGMGMNGMGGMGMGGMNMNGMGGMGMNGMGGMGMNGMGGMGMNGMGMGQMGGFGAILNAVNNNLPKLSQQPAQPQQQAQGGNYPQNTPQNYGGQNPNYAGPNYPQSPAANGPDPNVQAAQDAAAAQQKAAQDQEAQMQQPDPQDSNEIQDNKDQDTSQDSSINAKAGDGSDDDIKADNSNGNDDLNLPSEDTINAQQDNTVVDEQNPPLDNLQPNQHYDNAQLGQFGHYDTGLNSANMAAAAGG